jgi:pimeloyl-ACP methyl ester carboxylesterase
MDNQKLASGTRKRQRRRATPLALRLLRLWFQVVGRAAPGIAARRAYRLWFQTRRFGEPPRETGWLNDAQQEYIEHPAGPLAATIWGKDNRPTVLLLHGWNGRGSQMGAFAGPLVDAGYRVVAYDLPAHGRSPGNSTNLFEVIDTLRHVAGMFTPVRAIVAHSFGAVSAIMAAHEGLPVERLVCISPPNSLRFMLERFGRILAIPPRAQAALARRIETNFGNNVWERVSMDHLVATLRVPGLVVHDEQDYDVAISEGDAIARSWPKAQLVRTRGLGHRRILRDTKVVRTVVGFIQGVPGSDGAS